MPPPNTPPPGAIIIDRPMHKRDDQDEVAYFRAVIQRTPREIPAMYFYDEVGSRLFEEICEQPEYYQTRTEKALLESIAEDLVTRTGAEELVELGSGAATKTRVLLRAMAEAGQLPLFVPIEVSEEILRRTAEELIVQFPGLTVHGIVGDFTEDLGHLPAGGRRLVVFLGGTIGNFPPPLAASLLTQLGSEMDLGDFLLLGTDLIKEEAALEAAYNDAAGITARFNRNILSVVNRRFGADFDPGRYAHRAIYNREAHRIEMWLRALEAQTVHIRELDLTFPVAAGEEILTEISIKYDRAGVAALLERSGFLLEEWFTDPDRRFALSLARKGTPGP